MRIANLKIEVNLEFYSSRTRRRGGEEVPSEENKVTKRRQTSLLSFEDTSYPFFCSFVIIHYLINSFGEDPEEEASC